MTTWLYRVAANAAISRYRSRSRRWEYEFRAEDEVLHQIPASTTTAEVAEARLELDVVDRALAHLPENYRLVIVLRDVYGLSLEELAAELGISVVAAKVRLHRARKRLRERVYGAVDAEAEE